MSIRKTLVRLSLIVPPPLAAVGLITSAAAAHGGDITIEASGSVSGTTVTYSVHMIWEDGHDVIGQGVVINASGPGGSRSATLSPTNSSGRTSGSIDLGEGTWSVTLETGDRRVEFWADGTQDWGQIYTDPSRQAIAIEPMTCGPDAFNEGPTHDGVIVLEPGETTSCSWGIIVS